MTDIHKNIGTFDNNSIIHVMGGIKFFYIRILCSPDEDCFPWGVYTDNDKNITCKKCLNLMESEDAIRK